MRTGASIVPVKTTIRALRTTTLARTRLVHPALVYVFVFLVSIWASPLVMPRLSTMSAISIHYFLLFSQPLLDYSKSSSSCQENNAECFKIIPSLPPEIEVSLTYFYISVENVLVKTLVKFVVLDFHNDFLSSLNHIRTIALSEAGVNLFYHYFAPLLATSKMSIMSSAIIS